MLRVYINNFDILHAFYDNKKDNQILHYKLLEIILL